MKKVSIKDVALKSGASVSTVSIVMNGKAKERKISEKTIARVLEAAKELAYVPNSLARSLRTGKTNTIGLIVDDISNFFFGHLAKAIELEVEKFGYSLILCNSKNDEGKIVDVLAQLIDKQMDGFIIAPTRKMEKNIMQLKHDGIPFVLIDRFLTSVQSDYVVIDNFKGGYDATLHLMNRGYKGIGIVIERTDQIQIKERYRGYRSALRSVKSLELPAIEHHITSRESPSKSGDKLIEFLRGNPEIDSLLFTSNQLGILGLDCFRKHGLTVGKDLGIICFDDNDVFRLTSPAITVLSQPIKEIGKKAVESLMLQIGAGAHRLPRKIMLKPKLIIRDSTPKTIFCDDKCNEIDY